MGKLTKEDLDRWFILNEQLINGWHLEPSDIHELVRLNDTVIQHTHNIHNKNMMEWMK
jgi:hypothetical protein